MSDPALAATSRVDDGRGASSAAAALVLTDALGAALGSESAPASARHEAPAGSPAGVMAPTASAPRVPSEPARERAVPGAGARAPKRSLDPNELIDVSEADDGR